MWGHREIAFSLYPGKVLHWRQPHMVSVGKIQIGDLESSTSTITVKEEEQHLQGENNLVARKLVRSAQYARKKKDNRESATKVFIKFRTGENAPENSVITGMIESGGKRSDSITRSRNHGQKPPVAGTLEGDS